MLLKLYWHNTYIYYSNCPKCLPSTLTYFLNLYRTLAPAVWQIYLTFMFTESFFDERLDIECHVTSAPPCMLQFTVRKFWSVYPPGQSKLADKFWKSAPILLWHVNSKWTVETNKNTRAPDLSRRFNPRDSQRLYVNDDISLKNSHISVTDPTVVFIHGFTESADGLSASTVKEGRWLDYIDTFFATNQISSKMSQWCRA